MLNQGSSSSWGQLFLGVGGTPFPSFPHPLLLGTSLCYPFSSPPASLGLRGIDIPTRPPFPCFLLLWPRPPVNTGWLPERKARECCSLLKLRAWTPSASSASPPLSLHLDQEAKCVACPGSVGKGRGAAFCRMVCSCRRGSAFWKPGITSQ